MRDTRRRAQRHLEHDTLALVLAGGNGTRLGGLTRTSAKPAIPFGGHYRIVDFTLSNCINSGIPHVALLTQYKAQTLIRHVQRRWQARGFSDSIEIWPAQQRQGERWYLGTADAVHQNRDLILSMDPDYVLVAAGDHVYAMDYAHLIADHVAHGADATVSCVEVPVAEAHDFGIVGVDARMRLRGFEEKPAQPRARPGRRAVALASMGIYVFRTQFLLDCLADDARDAGSRHDFGYSILPRIIGHANVHAHVFADEDRSMSYWRDVGTLDSYWLAHMDLVVAPRRLALNDRRWPLGGGPQRAAPAHLAPSAMVAATILSAGCDVAGQVTRSVVSTHCRIGPGSVVQDAVLLPNVSVGRDCVLQRVIVDSGCSIPDGTVISGDLVAMAEGYEISNGGITLVTSAPSAQTSDAEPRVKLAIA